MEVVMEDVIYCTKCNFETNELIKDCPECGRRLMKSKTVRRLGWVLLFIGLFLLTIMSGISFVVAQAIYQTGRPGSTTSFTGDSRDVAFIVGIFSVVFAIGFTSIAGGIWQIKYGKRNKKIVFLMIGLAVVFFIVARSITGLK
jgi:predicted RNA-binding Zn-ribbon protein involved in translation (DUF1610 family)